MIQWPVRTTNESWICPVGRSLSANQKSAGSFSLSLEQVTLLLLAPVLRRLQCSPIYLVKFTPIMPECIGKISLTPQRLLYATPGPFPGRSAAVAGNCKREPVGPERRRRIVAGDGRLTAGRSAGGFPGGSPESVPGNLRGPRDRARFVYSLLHRIWLIHFYIEFG